jgi:exopolysaccharide biosynthesis polyprenyl glycosylphosphotransferase
LQLLFCTILVPVDVVAVLAAFSVAFAISRETGAAPAGQDFGQFLSVFLAVTPAWVAVFAVVGLYAESGARNRWDEIGKIFVAALGPPMMLLAADSLQSPSVLPSKELPVYGYALTFAFVLAGRQLVHRTQHALFARDLGVQRVLVVGSGPVAQRLVSSLGFTRRSGYRVVGVIDASGARGVDLAGLPVYRTLDEARRALRDDFDEFIHADSSLAQDDILAIQKYARDHNLSYRFVPNQCGLYAPDSVLGSLAGVPVVKIRQTPLEGWGRVIKRGFDVVGALAALLLVSPLLAVVAAVVALGDPGPVLFRQERLARNGRSFRILKFRTMPMRYSGRPAVEVFRELGREDLVAEFTAEQKVKSDPRVSRTGAFLRRTSLDELPQLWNVLRGDLSLVGPRPIVPDELPKFGDHGGTILALKPGITGLWQTSGRNDLTYDERVRLNILYVEHWSLLLDIVILLRTVRLVLTGGGAY